jgi:hypothetical protein
MLRALFAPLANAFRGRPRSTRRRL